MRACSAVPKVTLFFITFNQRDIAVQTLQDALAQDYPLSRLDIVMLDDGSTDGSYQALVETAACAENRWKVIAGQHDGHYRSGALWNRCIAEAASDTEVFVQVDDVRLGRDFVRRHVDWHRFSSNLIVTGAKFEGRDETWELSACRRHILAEPGGCARFDVPATAIWGASLSYPQQLLKATCSQPSERPYDELMMGYGHHEVEFAFRVLKAGGRTVYDPSVGVFHRDHEQLFEHKRGFDRQELIQGGLEQNARYICVKHGLSTLPRW